MAATGQQARWRRYWDKQAGRYDRDIAAWDRRLFGDSRAWACGRARGEVLEVAVGTGLNLPFYPDGTVLTGIDLSEGMLAVARDRAERLGHPATLRQGDAHSLPFDDAGFDTVVCTFGLCAIPDPDTALDEMLRVLRPHGRLVLVDHIASSSAVVRGVQRVLQVLTVRATGEHYLRRPLLRLRALGVEVEETERFKLGIVERVVARKPAD